MQTANLDGESALKLRVPLFEQLTVNSLIKLQVWVVCVGGVVRGVWCVRGVNVHGMCFV